MKWLPGAVARVLIVTAVVNGIFHIGEKYGPELRRKLKKKGTSSEETVIKITKNGVKCVQGAAQQALLSGIRDVVKSFSLETGTIRRRADGKITFSRTIPDEARQRLRNVIQIG